MELLQLKYFKTVARLEHITKAANELHIAQPALSITISRLEEDLGVPLFNRTGRNIQLNEYGKVFLKRVNNIIAEIEAGRQELLDMHENFLGSVSISSSSVNSNFSEVLGSFSDLYPKSNFRIIQISDDKSKLNLLESDEIDFAFINSTSKNPELTEISLLDEDIFLAVSPNHHLASKRIISFKELSNESFINLNNNNNLHKIYEKLCEENGFTKNIVCECSDSSSLTNLVATGLGVSFFPSAHSSLKDIPVVLLKIEDLNYKNTLKLVWKNNHYFSKAALHFREYVIKYFENTATVASTKT